MKAMYAGSFDPITNGHLDIIKQAVGVFDHVVICVSTNPKKTGTQLFSPSERVALILAALEKEIEPEWVCPTGHPASVHLRDHPISVYAGTAQLTVSTAEQFNCSVLIRGLRAVSDFDLEFQMVQFNRKIKSGINTVFFMPDERYFYLSSSAVREIHSMGGDVSEFVPACVATAMAKLS